MRLDKYLKVSRLIKRRTVANDACDGAKVSVNGRPAKASYDVKVGDRIEIQFGARTVAVYRKVQPRVLFLPMVGEQSPNTPRRTHSGAKRRKI